MAGARLLITSLQMRIFPQGFYDCYYQRSALSATLVRWQGTRVFAKPVAGHVL